MNRRADRGRMGKSQKSAKPYGRATPLWIPQSGIQFSPSLSQAKDYPSINVRKILDTTFCLKRMRAPFAILNEKTTMFISIAEPFGCFITLACRSKTLFLMEHLKRRRRNLGA